jgi:hypothetical protein
MTGNFPRFVSRVERAIALLDAVYALRNAESFYAKEDTDAPSSVWHVAILDGDGNPWSPDVPAQSDDAAPADLTDERVLRFGQPLAVRD